MTEIRRSSQAGEPSEAVVIVLAGEQPFIRSYTIGLQSDSRIRLVATANDARRLAEYVIEYKPEAIFVDAALWTNTTELARAFSRFSCNTYVVVPDNFPDSGIDEIRGSAVVKGVYRDSEVVMSKLITKIIDDAGAQRISAPVRRQITRQGGRAVAQGLFTIAVYNKVGGSGKSTVAAALGEISASRGYHTLLVGLSAPCALPAILNLKAGPNIENWIVRPRYGEGFQASVQRAGELDVIVGLSDGLQEEKLFTKPGDPNSISSLVDAAVKEGRYSVIILDVPVTAAIAFHALSTCNTMVLVSRSTTPDVFASVEAYRIATTSLVGSNAIGGNNVFLVLNQHNDRALNPDTYHKLASELARHFNVPGFPPVTACIQHNWDVPLAVEHEKTPMTAADTFARSLHVLADALFGEAPGSPDAGRKTFSFAGIKVKVRK
jgi:cellulose biosynthesis protein BcsQ